MRWFSFICLLPARSESLAARSWLYAERMAIYTCGLGPLVTRSSSHHSFRHPHARDSWSSILSALHTLNAPTSKEFCCRQAAFAKNVYPGNRS